MKNPISIEEMFSEYMYMNYAGSITECSPYYAHCKLMFYSGFHAMHSGLAVAQENKNLNGFAEDIRIEIENFLSRLESAKGQQRESGPN